MKQESHRLLGYYLIGQLNHMPKLSYRRAFLIGCVEPDRNFLSYLKGSIRSRWFYGHNYQNADRWIERHINRLKSKARWNIWSYYCLGKLIHYTSDAFTYVHNNCFTASIAAHRAYEDELQEHFLHCLAERRCSDSTTRPDINRVLRAAHRRYLKNVADVQRDCRYILNMTSWLFNELFPEPSAAY